MTASHVFVTHADLHRLSCDAWLLPTDVHGTVTPGWLAGADAPTQRWLRSLSRGLPSTCEVMPVAPTTRGAPCPVIVATDVGRTHGASPSAFLPAVAEFVSTAARAARSRPLVAGRERPLLAIPAIGTGEGGASDTAGALLRELFPALRELAAEHAVDLAFVARTRSMHAAAQRAARRRGSVLGAHGHSPRTGPRPRDVRAIGAAGPLPGRRRQRRRRSARLVGAAAAAGDRRRRHLGGCAVDAACPRAG